MKLLRIFADLREPAGHCQWTLVENGRAPVSGAGPLTDLPSGVGRVQLVLPAAHVLLTHVRLPRGSRQRGGSVLGFAVEDRIAGEPEANQVSWLGVAGGDDVLAVTDAKALASWQGALAKLAIRVDEVHCETLLLPFRTGEWSLAWNGREGFVRSGQFQGAATDCGDSLRPPLCLHLMIEEARRQGIAAATLAIFTTAPEGSPELDAWQSALGVPVRMAGLWDWRSAPADAGVALPGPSRPWHLPGALVKRLSPAAWILAAALSLHGLSLAIDWSLLGLEQRQLRKGMESQFRLAFPDTVAVADPALQMRRKLAQQRHVGGLADARDFVPMIALVATAAKELPVGVLRKIAYEDGRMTLSLDAAETGVVRRFEARLIQAGLGVDTSLPGDRSRGPAVLVVSAP